MNYGFPPVSPLVPISLITICLIIRESIMAILYHKSVPVCGVRRNCKQIRDDSFLVNFLMHVNLL